MQIAGILHESLVDGPGIRSVVFGQGCPRHCVGCHNPDCLDLNGGNVMSLEDVLAEILKAGSLTNGITFSGGDPFMQARSFAMLGKRIKEERDVNIWTYTGYTWEELIHTGQNDLAFMELLAVTNVIVDGPFVESLKNLSLPFRGSGNQRIIDVKESLRLNDIVIAQL